ncbi:MAG: T9SS type A sorting domain-containing protein [Bacteroidales bacterium]|nr:T9SS type A sorting domain-containing protein [Bacteroidales bacterium]
MKKKHYPYTICIVVLTVYFTVLSQAVLFAQTAVSANVSNTRPVAGEEIAVNLSVSDALDFYYGSIEVSCQEDLLEFLSVENTGLSQPGINNSGPLGTGTTGASVSRTDPLENPSAGSYMILNFLVKNTAPSTTTDLTFANQEIFDSGGNEIPTDPVNAIPLEIQESISDLDMAISAENTVTEGETFDVTGTLYATGITDTGRIETRVGISEENTDPSTWDDSVWMEMEYTEKDANDYLYYTREIAYKRPIGTWYVALRSRLDDGSWVYGGTEGIWEAEDSPNAVLYINRKAPYRHTLAEWNFDEETLTPSYSIPANQESGIELSGASFEGYASGASGRAANSNKWEDGSDGSKYWWTAFSTSDFTDIELSSKQYGSNTGPRDYRIEISTDGNTWEEVDGGNIRVGNNWSSGVLDTLALPESIADREYAFIRWAMAGDTSVNNGDIGSSGTNRLDDVLITGVNAAPQRLAVYPGDANGDSLVNADDVLALGRYWLTHGPAPVYNSTEFAAREVEAWIPPEATHADTRGDGQVDHRDLMPIGLHFNQSVSATLKLNEPPLTEMVIEPQQAGAIIPLTIACETHSDLRGVALSLAITGIDAEQWEIQNIQPLFCPETWFDNLLSFTIKRDNTFELAYVLKGTGDITSSRELIALDLKARNDWPGPVTASLNRATISNANSNTQPIRFLNITGTNTQERSMKYGSELLANQPNPFHDYTMIPYEISSETHVRLEVLNMQGQVISTLVDQFQNAGKYTHHFDPSDFPAGIYLYRMQTGSGYVKCRKMSVVK